MRSGIKWNKTLLKHFSWKADLLAGLTVAVIIIPQGMAYAMLAGLPAIYGLYAAFIPLMIYPLFGSSRHLSVGPVALVSIILFVGLSTIADPGTPEFIQLALLTSLVAGIIQIALALFRLGILVKFLSDPVIHGFTAAAAIIIIMSQLKSILGIELSASSNVIQIIRELLQNVVNTHIPTFIIGVSALALILLIKRIKNSLPAGLIAVILGTILMYVFSWHEMGVALVGQVPKGLPDFTSNFIKLDQIIQIVPLAFVICLISFIESLAIAKSIAARHDNYVINANQELFSLGLAKIVGSFFQAFPNTGSFSRSAVNDESGAKSGISSMFAAFFIGITLLFLTPLFYYLPKPILGAIIITAVLGLLNIKYGINLWHADRKDFYVFLATGLLTLLFGIQQGVLAGIILSVIMILLKTSKPHYAILGNLPETTAFRNIKRFPDARTREDMLILRYDQDLYFGNAEHFYDTVMNEIGAHPHMTKFILNASGITQVDSTGISKFKLLLNAIKKQRIKFIITQIRGPIRDQFDHAGILDEIGLENIYLNVNDAVKYEISESEGGHRSRRYAGESRLKAQTKTID